MIPSKTAGKAVEVFYEPTKGLRALSIFNRCPREQETQDCLAEKNISS